IANAVGMGSTTFVDWLVGMISAGAPGAAAMIRALVEHVDFTVFGTLGAAVLFATTVLGLGTVEGSLNDIWGVASGRGFARRFADYLAVLVVAPLLGGLALSLGASIEQHWPASRLPAIPFVADPVGAWIPVAMLSVAFTFLYWFLPNAAVRVVSAAIGGAFAGIAVTLAQSYYVHFSIGVARADAFFGSFALLPLLFAWIYLFWAIVLLGAEVAFAHQNFALYRQEVRGAPATAAEREAIALQTRLDVARCFTASAPAPHANALADELQVPVRTVRAVAQQLVDAGILSTRADAGQEQAFQLGRPAEAISASDVLLAVRGRRKPNASAGDRAAYVAGLLDEIEGAAHKGAGDRSLAELLRDLGAPGPIDPSAVRG